MCRLSNPYRATTDLDVVDRHLGEVPQLQLLRAAKGAEPVEPSAVLLPTQCGQVKVDVLEVRQVEIDQPSDDPGDRLHASSHAWANDTASDEQARATALAQLGGCNASTATDIALHVDLWLVQRRKQALRLIPDAGGVDLAADDLDLAAELLLIACGR